MKLTMPQPGFFDLDDRFKKLGSFKSEVQQVDDDA
jgi:hypothetical protein